MKVLGVNFFLKHSVYVKKKSVLITYHHYNIIIMLTVGRGVLEALRTFHALTCIDDDADVTLKFYYILIEV